MEKITTCELTDGPHKGRTVLGKEILDRVGPIRFSEHSQAEMRATDIAYICNLNTEILEETKEVFRHGFRHPGKVFWVAINNQPEEERE